MPYAEIDDVQAYIPWFSIGDNSKPNTAQVTEFIRQTQAEVDSAIKSSGIAVTPITEPEEFLAELESLVAMGAGARTLLAAYPDASGGGSTGAGNTLWRAYWDRLNQIRKGEGLPSSLSSPGNSPRSFFTDLTGGFSPEPVEDAWGTYVNTEPRMSRNKVF